MVSTTLIMGLFSPSSVTVEGAPQLDDEALYPEERAYVAGALPKRRAEFTTARQLARRALSELGEPPVPLPPRADRSPVWPSGIVGSISHTTEYCAVVVNRAADMESIGLDVEALRPVEVSLWDSIMTAREMRWLRAQSASRHNDLALLHFSAKEAYYKCQYTLTESFLEFLDVEVDLHLESGTYEARVLKPSFPARVRLLRGRFAMSAGKVLCGVELAPL